MTLKSLVSHSIEAYTLVRSEQRPSDVVLSEYLRSRKYLGSHDRKFISETVYGTLRLDLTLETYAESAIQTYDLDVNLRFGLIIFFYLMYKAPVSDGAGLITTHSELFHLSIEKLSKIELSFSREFLVSNHSLPLSKKYAFPNWMSERLSAYHDKSFLESLFISLNQEAPLTLRANTFITSRVELQEALTHEGIQTSLGILSPDALICDGRRQIFQSTAFKRGWCEIQDEGSQVISILANPKPKMIVLDACAGGGGKTLHLATLMKNKGKVYAYDKNPKRLGNIRERIKRSGLQNIEILDSEEKKNRFFKQFHSEVDCVLIDAPCTGSGTLRRNPDLKRRLTEDSLHEITSLQSDILENFAPLVKLNGKLVYATCSIFNEENENQIHSFLNRHPSYSLQPVFEVASNIRHQNDLSALISRLGNEPYLKLYPHRDNTDGFFAAILNRHSLD